ncbi:MAG: site-specific DNA-methyltransferase [Phycisphaerales bacterium]|nr:site-specific DNA-methyltransferase [Phycisphaerales bacterium]
MPKLPRLPLHAPAPPAWNTVHCADCADFAQRLPAATFDFIYLDPPYFTNRRFNIAPRRETPAIGTGFDDRWPGGLAQYLAMVKQAAVESHRVLKADGVLLLHLDWRSVHYAKVMLDEVFGFDKFINEIIWYYQTGGASPLRFSRKHDTILLYARSGQHYFNGKAIAIPRTPKALHRARNPKGARISAANTHKNPDDVLLIPALNPMARERTGYPTQKPLALLETLITALCPPGGTVGDLFCGSGTTLMAAAMLKRPFLGCDQNRHAVAIARHRLQKSPGART